jgi:hypothetical protein
VKEVFLDEDRRPKLLSGRGYASRKFHYDERDTPDDAEYFDEADRPVRTEVVIETIFPGGEGNRVGLRPGDVLLRYDGEDVVNAPRLAATIRRRAESGKAEPVKLLIRRAGRQLAFDIAPGLPLVALIDVAVRQQ